MKKIFMVLLGVGLFLASFQVMATPSCSKNMIRSTYAMVYSGASSVCWYFGGTGIVKFKGSSGEVTVNGTESCDGVSSSFTGTGTYTVKSNCTGIATVNFNTGGSGTYAFTIAENGNSIVFMVTTAGVTGTGFAKKL